MSMFAINFVGDEKGEKNSQEKKDGKKYSFLKEFVGYCYGQIKKITNYLTYYKNSKSNQIKSDVKIIEFICYGNICRSAFAERYANKVIKQRGLKIKCSSSGLCAENNKRSPQEAVKAALLYNVDLSRHLSKKTTKKKIQSADIVFCMHFSHYNLLLKRFPEYKKKVWLLKGVKGGNKFNLNIEDPYGKSQEKFGQVFKEISDCIDMVVTRFKLSGEETCATNRNNICRKTTSV